MTPTAKPAESPSTLERIRRRHDALRAVRAFFFARGFLEVDTPLLVPGPGLEPHIDPLSVSVRTTMDPDASPGRRFLITSPELALKRLVAAGAQRIFQIGHVFRDGERSARHLPEFTMIEWYRAGGTLDELVRDHEELFAEVAHALGVPAPPAPFARATVAELFARYAGVDLPAALSAMEGGDARALVRAVEAQGAILRPSAPGAADFEDAFFHVMTHAVEPHIGRERPIVVERWPAPMAVLARKAADDPRFAGRFEVYAGGLELSNAFDELTDPVEQRARFEADNRLRRALGKAELPLDEDFLAVLGRMPPTAGCALGFDRLLMHLLQLPEIEAVTALPWR
jgi:elongation factor P--(R)-beta-lysine ligase